MMRRKRRHTVIVSLTGLAADPHNPHAKEAVKELDGAKVAGERIRVEAGNLFEFSYLSLGTAPKHSAVCRHMLLLGSRSPRVERRSAMHHGETQGQSLVCSFGRCSNDSFCSCTKSRNFLQALMSKVD